MHVVLATTCSILLLQLLGPLEARALSIAGPTSEWMALFYPGTTPDPVNDLQTGQDESDIVGTASLAALYTQYDAGTLSGTSDDVLAFRMRMGTEDNPPGYSRVAMVGMDADGDGSLDMYVVVDNTGQNEIALYTVGTQSNTSPSTTDTSPTAFTYAETAANYDWSPVSTLNCSECTALDLDIDGDGNDYFLSFAVPFDDVLSVLALDGITGVTPDTPVGYVMGTATNPNAYNQDIGGVDGAPAANTTWLALNAMSVPGGINPVPEPGTGLLLGLGLAGIAVSRRRRPLRR